MSHSEFGTVLIEPTSIDLPKLADTLAQAFMDDPVLSWTLRQDNRRKWALRRYFTFLLGNAVEEGEVMAFSTERCRQTHALVKVLKYE